MAGFSKTGVPGLGILMAPLMADVFPARASVGALTPMLLCGDFFAVRYYRRHAQWKILIRLIPWVAVGFALGYVALRVLNDVQLGAFLGAMILALIAIQIVKQRGGEWLEEHLPRKWWFSASMGVLAGFTTMVGNVAGPITGLYFLSMGFDKHSFMGTSAWFFLMVNAAKIPFYLQMGIVNGHSLLFNLKMLPLILAGVAAGVFTFKRISQKWFDRTVLGLAALAAVRLLVKSILESR